jgi:sugar-specific transcriptional regulator TrmB
MDTKILEDIGLTKGEIKVYLALLKIGQSSTGAIAQEANVSRSKLYVILNKLTKKGFIGSVIKGKVQHFSATEPRRMLDYIEEKKQDLDKKENQLKEIIPQIDSMLNEEGKTSEATIYEGFRGVTNLFRNILDELKKGDTYYVLGASYGDVEGLRPFFHNHHLRRTEKGIKLMMLANEEVKENIEASTKKNAEIKFLPKYLATKMEIVIYSNKCFIAIWTKKPMAFLIHNEEAYRSFKEYFDAFWRIARN